MWTFVPVECHTLFRSLLLLLTDDCCIDVQVRLRWLASIVAASASDGGGAERWSTTGVGDELVIAELVNAELVGVKVGL